ncbi:PilX N-terminal domain-containing pilus assembly protein [Pseudomonas sp. 5S4]|uniref:pilus assembly PilX family protein n=2 Tax=Pseudomonas TaxID=286 RepID=UPI002B23A953|nr:MULTISPECIES: PilX N-terminal domain-containing pilus assembly protein [unclassified Pseudomonas]MEA9976053.1 PilX N-terminal domain-containing pilus assembly protein [Pseudomonas sp. RTS4]MEB0198051.1 PilX N-terminal domain-containing pilus assembly protein [Pseudomonas sp. 5S4]MEB0245708.1 PilX N-terminal domain-containing pilus assembly protein [Pseudomonas sp. 10S5]
MKPLMSMYRQRGTVLLISLVFLLLMTLIGLSSLKNATLQEKMAGSVKLRNQSFQAAEAALRIGESAVQQPGYSLARCIAIVSCAPPQEAFDVTMPGANPTSGVTWIATKGGFYAVQNFAETTEPINVPSPIEGTEPKIWTLYRVTGVGIQGRSRTVLESVYALDRRIMWRQIQ